MRDHMQRHATLLTSNQECNRHAGAWQVSVHKNDGVPILMLQVPMGILESINLEVIDLGESPVRLGGMKVGSPCNSICAANQALSVLHHRNYAAVLSISSMPDHDAPSDVLEPAAGV
jgi:hypothetical protein